MKIIHVQDIFHPEAGYQENVISKYHSDEGHDVTVITAETEKLPASILGFFGSDDIRIKDEAFYQEHGVKIIRMPILCYVSGRAIYKEHVFKIINEMKPDILFIHGNDTYLGIRFAFKLGKLDFPVIYDNHMLDIAAHNPLRFFYYFFYKQIVAKKIIKNKVIVIRTEDDNFVQKRLGIPEYLSPVIRFGSDIRLFKKDYLARNEKRMELGIPDKNFVVIYAGKLDRYKGGMILAEAIKEKFNTEKVITFVIVGNFVGEYGRNVSDLIYQSENQVILLPTQKYIDLPEFFQMADCVVYPKECSLTFYDAQACGLPAIIDDLTEINRNRVRHGNGYTYMSGDINDLREKIITLAELDEKEYNKMSNNAVEFVRSNYNYEIILEHINREISNQFFNWNQLKKDKHTRQFKY